MTVRGYTIPLIFVFLFTPPMQAAEPREFPPEFGKWVQERVGPVVFPEGSSRTWEQFTGLATELGAHAVKTWVGADRPGDALAKLQTAPYRELVRKFSVVHFNISPGYIVKDYGGGTIAPSMLAAIRQEWHDITRWLCKESAEDRTLLLSVGGEINVYVGTEGAYPDFPVAEYVNACHAGKEAALAELEGQPHAQVFSVAEIQGDKEFERFVERWAPEFETDLMSLSYYTFYRPLDEALEIVRRSAKPHGPFGDRRLMLGEYGPSLESCNWNQAEHLRWHHDILEQAFKAHVQYAFFYEIADHEFVIKTGSHDGLVTWAPEAVPRLAWHYYQRLYRGGNPALPTLELYETPPRQPPAPSEGQAARLHITAPEVVQSAPQTGQRLSFRTKVRNEGAAKSADGSVNFYVDDRLVSWVWFPGIEPGKEIALESVTGDARFVWIAREGPHRVTAVLDPLHRIPDLAEEDRTQDHWFRVAPNP